MLTKAHRQEGLSRAYVQAVAACAGMSCTPIAQDYGIDLALRTIKRWRGRHFDDGLQLDIQLKSTARAAVGDEYVTYDLDVKNYDALRFVRPKRARVLVVLVLPEDEGQWLSQSEEELLIRHCAYWLSLAGQPATTAKKTIRVAIPRINVFSVANLQAIMQRLDREADL